MTPPIELLLTLLSALAISSNPYACPTGAGTTILPSPGITITTPTLPHLGPTTFRIWTRPAQNHPGNAICIEPANLTTQS